MKRDEITEILVRFKQLNQTKYDIIKIGLFGSAAKGDLKPGSDIDVVVMLGKQDLFNLIGIKQDLEEQLSSVVDIISYRERMNPFLKSRIDKEALYV
ncbi:MAG: nucleotidyltransferase domain-containing protein [Deltaproteobacteria bacterium]|nr:nucleotidyltransferase domain-containing protein [Deltaproteobacteria bacterium]MBW2042496.1 nucleotidyltransferase domain-containing protein [Deltaproteobacteria bacterium]MBW2133134.1 nucleotidyltransferase domain-containing protein [Deltaproteobacteria bacterium]